MSIKLEEINKLRKITGVGIMSCKNALEEAEGDIDKAIIILRKRGLKLTEKRKDNETKEGLTFSVVNDNHDFGVIAALRCETDFAANSDGVRDFMSSLCNYALENKCKNIDDVVINGNKVNDEILNLIAKIGEKVCIEYDYIDGGNIDNYTHFNNRISVLLQFEGDDTPENIKLCHDLCLQAAAMNPLCLSREQVDASTREREQALAHEEAVKKAKNEEIAVKIEAGYMNNFYKNVVLTEQEFMKEPKVIVKQLLEKNNIKLTDYKRLQI